MAPWLLNPLQLPLASVEADPAEYPDTAQALANATDFAFSFQQGSNFMHRFDVLEIDAAGRATLTFGESKQRATFRLSRRSSTGSRRCSS